MLPSRIDGLASEDRYFISPISTKALENDPTPCARLCGLVLFFFNFFSVFVHAFLEVKRRSMKKCGGQSYARLPVRYPTERGLEGVVYESKERKSKKEKGMLFEG